TNVPPGVTNVVQLETGGVVNLALLGNGTVAAWGSSPTNIPNGLSNVVMISMANVHSIAIVGNHLPITKAASLNPSVSDDNFSFELLSESGRVYAPEYSELVSGGVWYHLPMQAGTGTNLLITDSNVTNLQRFYRVRRW
ncbi:MAG: hypothetical protein H7Y43_10800, partial [Akkermansiaceae bacterium]|nr:hypothetical protein [Verrucomicrobiales bacterium]